MAKSENQTYCGTTGGMRERFELEWETYSQREKDLVNEALRALDFEEIPNDFSIEEVYEDVELEWARNVTRKWDTYTPEQQNELNHLFVGAGFDPID